jgi:hypothetical protein
LSFSEGLVRVGVGEYGEWKFYGKYGVKA